MKKLIFGLIATVLVSVSVSANQKNDLQISKNNALYEQSCFEESNLEIIKSKISIRFGRVSRGCSGFGVCQFTANVDLGVIEIEAIYDPNANEGTGEMSLKVTPKFERELRNHFGYAGLIIEESFVIEDEGAIRELGINQRFEIGAGNYPIQDGKIVIKNSTKR